MSFIFIALPYLLQLLCIIHVVRTGRNSTWIYIIIFVPIAGGLAYLFVEILPSLLGAARHVRSPSAYADIVLRSISPSARLRRYEKDAAFSPTHENRRILADEYQACGDYARALAIYDAIATGTFRLEPDLALQRARCLYATGKFPEGRALVEELEKSGFPWRKEKDVLVKLKLQERNEGDPAPVARLYADYEKKFQSFEFGYYEADFLIRNHMNDAALEVIGRFDGVRRQLDSMRMVYDRPWARRLSGLRAAAARPATTAQ
jgi:hypothetical protein